MRRTVRLATSPGKGASKRPSRGSVHPSPPTNLHNPARSIEPLVARERRQADYRARHKSFPSNL